MENLNTKKGDGYDVNELNRELDEIFNGEIGFAEIQRIDEINEILAKMNNIEKFSDKYAKKKIKQKLLLNEQRPKDVPIRGIHHKFKHLVFATIIIIILLVTMASTTFIGANLFDIFSFWGNESVELKTVTTLPNNVNDNSIYFQSISELQEVFDDKLMIPDYLPNEMQLERIEYIKSSNTIFLSFISNDKTKFADLDIQVIDNNEATLSIEKNEGVYDLISEGDIDYYIFKNMDTTVIQWKYGTFVYNLSGDFDESDTKKIIKKIK